jgi:hypothetical protein
MNLIFADNGSGMAEGITLENQTSLGLRLVHRLTGQLHGTVRVEVSGGTRFLFVFPKPEENTKKEPLVHIPGNQLPGAVATDRMSGMRFVTTALKPAVSPEEAVP